MTYSAYPNPAAISSQADQRTKAGCSGATRASPRFSRSGEPDRPVTNRAFLELEDPQTLGRRLAAAVSLHPVVGRDLLPGPVGLPVDHVAVAAGWLGAGAEDLVGAVRGLRAG